LIEFCLLLVIVEDYRVRWTVLDPKFSPPCQAAENVIRPCKICIDARYVPWVLARDFFMCVFLFQSSLYSDPPFFIAASAFGRKCVDHDTEESHRKREKPLVPKYQLRDPKFVQSVNVSCSLQFHLNACFNLYHECVQLRTQLSICLSR